MVTSWSSGRPPTNPASRPAGSPWPRSTFSGTAPSPAASHAVSRASELSGSVSRCTATTSLTRIVFAYWSACTVSWFSSSTSTTVIGRVGASSLECRPLEVGLELAPLGARRSG